MDQQEKHLKIMADKGRNEKHKIYLDMRKIQTEGLKIMLHGVDYQLHLLMLFLWRAKQNEYFSFRLGTELKEAGKFDDVVLQYQDKENDTLKLRLVQVKHINNKNENISEKDLLSKIDKHNFSLQKYFHSFLKIKRECSEKSMYSVFFGSEIEDLIICTNVDLEPRIKSYNWFEKVNFEIDKILKLNKELKGNYQNIAVYMFKNIENNDIIKNLKPVLLETSDLCNLINELVQCCADNQVETKQNNRNQSNSKKLENSYVLDYYYYALTRDVFLVEVINSENAKETKIQKKYCAKFLPKFIKDEDSNYEIRQFRNELIKKIIKEHNILTEDNIRKYLETLQFNVSNNFAKKFVPEKRPEIKGLQTFAKEIKCILDNSDGKVLQIPANNNALVPNVRQLAGYVLIRKYNVIHFSTSFLDGAKLPGNLNEFRECLKELLGDEKFFSLYEYDIEIKDKKFKTCEEGALDRKLPTLCEDGQLHEFFSKFKIVVNYPNANDIENVIGEEMKDSFKRLNIYQNKSLYMQKLYKWLNDKKSYFFTKENTKTLFNDINKTIILLQIERLTKLYFRNAIKKYKFKEYESVTYFLQNTKQQILHLIFDELKLGRARVVQTFKLLRYKNNSGINDKDIDKYILASGHIFIKLTQLENDVVDCFNDNEMDNVLVIECDKEMETSLTDQLLYALNRNEDKKIIFITQKIYKLPEKFTNFNYTNKVDESKFTDLTKYSQKLLLQKEITFQGQKITLKDLLGAKSTEYFDSEVLSELIKNNDIEIDCNKSANLNEIREYFIDRIYDLELKIEISEDVFERNTSDLFIVTNVNEDELVNLNNNYWYNENTILYQTFFFHLIMLFEIHRKKLIDIYSSLEASTSSKIIHYHDFNKNRNHYFLAPILTYNQIFMDFSNEKGFFINQKNFENINIAKIFNSALDIVIEHFYHSYFFLKEQYNEVLNVVCIIYTNANFSPKFLRTNKIVQVNLNDIDQILDCERNVNDKVPTKNYRLICNNRYYHLLRQNSKTFKLAQALAACVLKTSSVNYMIVIQYVWQLEKEIIHFEHKKFHLNFIHNKSLSDAAKNIREELLCVVQENLEYKKCIMNIDDIWKMIEANIYNRNDLPNILNVIYYNPQFIDICAFTKKFIILLDTECGYNDKNIKIRLEKTILGNDLDNLAVHILVLNNCDDDTFKFSSNFLDINSKLPHNLQNFRDLVIEELWRKGKEFSDLKNYIFEIENFVTCLDKNESLPNDSVSEFLNKLIFRVSQPGEYELIDIVNKKLGYSFFSYDSMNGNIFNSKWINIKKNILYEHNLLTCFLNKIKENQYKNFCLARKVTGFDNFGDVVFKYTDKNDKTKQIFIKIMRNHDDEISYDNFSNFFDLLDIFQSHRKIKKHYEHENDVEKLFFIFTNVSFDFNILKLHNIHLEKVNKIHDILDMDNGILSYRLILDKQNEIYENVINYMKTSKPYLQAKYLVTCICDKNVIEKEELDNLLTLEVIDIKKKSLHYNFIHNKLVRNSAKVFREHFITLYRNVIKDEISAEGELWKVLQKHKLKLCSEFQTLLNDTTIQFLCEVILNVEDIIIHQVDLNEDGDTLIINVNFQNSIDKSPSLKSYKISQESLKSYIYYISHTDLYLLKENLNMSSTCHNFSNKDLTDFLTDLIFVQASLECQNFRRITEHESLNGRLYLNEPDEDKFDNTFKSKLYAGRVRTRSEEDLSQNKPIQIISSKYPNPKGLTQLFESYPNYTIHCLKKERKKYLWHTSQGPLTNLRNYIKGSTQKLKSTKITDSVVSITAEPGMGKSTLLKYLTEQIKASDPYKWVIKIDLINCQKELDEQDGKFDDLDKIIIFLCSILGLKNILEIKFLYFQIEKHGNIILLFDGLDEIEENNRKKVIRLLQALKNYKVEKLWLTTRHHLKIMIEDELSIISYNLKPFEDEHQINYLKKFWIKIYNLNGISDTEEQIINKYIRNLVNSFKKATNQNERDFLGIPLQSKLLAEAFQENFWEFYNATSQNKKTKFIFPKIINLLNLYKRFIDAKYEIHFNKIKPKLLETYENVLKTHFTKIHRYIAFKLLFPEKINFLEDIEINGGDQDVLKQIGILQSQNIELNFIHRTFAEYFAADQIAKLLKKDKNSSKYKKAIEILKELFFNNEREIIVQFIDRILGESHPILNAILNKTINFFENGKFEKCMIHICDALGRTALHLAATYNCNKIIYILLQKTNTVNIYDNLNWSPIQYAVRNSNWVIAELLLKAGANPRDIIKVINFKSSDKHGVTLLHFAAKYTNVAIVKILLAREFNINIFDNKRLTPLFYAIMGNKVHIIKYFIFMKADVNIADPDGLTPLFYAIDADNISILECLINANANINVSNKEGLDLISYAQKYNKFSIVKYLTTKR